MNFDKIFQNWGGDGAKTVDNTATVANSGTVANTGGDKNNDNKNVVVNDSDLLNDVWKANQPPPKPADAPPNNNGGDNGGNNGGNKTAVDPQALLAQHMKEVGLDPYTLTPEDQQSFKDGNFDLAKFVDGMNSRFQNGYVNIMRNTDKMIENKVDAALTKANQNTVNILDGVNLKNYLETSIPYIKDDQILGPVAETAFKAFYEKTGKDKERAVKLTQQFLTRTAETVNQNNPDLNINRGGYRGGNASDNRGDVDWIKAIRGEKQ